jgi:hypothetical protein
MTANRWAPVEGVPGEVVIASIGHPLEDPTSKGKPRPAVLIRRAGGHWLLMGLTTNPRYAGGTPRTPVPNPARVGLHGPGYLWGQPTWVSVLDLNKHIGWVDPTLAAVLADHVDLDPADTLALGFAAMRGSHPGNIPA